MKYNHIFFISPPFYSHFMPLMVLAKSFKKLGVKLTFGCSLEFKEKVLDAKLNFYEIDISKNKNIGKAEKTDQPDSEKKRLEEFFQATKKGAIETLITQSNHRKADMLYDPDELIEKIGEIDRDLHIDLFVVDILSYSVTLSLYFLKLPFITFCPPHPRTIPNKDENYGVPKNWPSAIEIKDEKLEELKKVSINTQKEFTDVFNKIISRKKELEKIDNAFSLVSPIATIYNYFDFEDKEQIKKDPKKIFIGGSFEEEKLDRRWSKKIEKNRKKIMISLGTFLSNRKDVLIKLIEGTRAIYPDALLIVSAGVNAESLKHYGGSNTIIEEFIPQKGLMPYMDTVIFHGGCNTFTESIYYANKMIILPFSSDQFNIAYDVEKNNIGAILDPNNFDKQDLSRAFDHIEKIPKDKIEYWARIAKRRGADYGANILLN